MKPVPSIPQHVTDPARVVVGVRERMRVMPFLIAETDGLLILEPLVFIPVFDSIHEAQLDVTA